MNFSRLAIVAAPEAATGQSGAKEAAGAKAQRRKARPASKVFEQCEKCLRKAGNRQRVIMSKFLMWEAINKRYCEIFAGKLWQSMAKKSLCVWT
jgi:hypothetical protein